MPVIPQQIAASIQGASAFVGGPTWIPFTVGVGQAVSIWATSNPANLSLVGVTTGSAGAGVVTGQLTVPPNPGIVIGALTSAGVAGITASQIGTAVAIGVATSMTATASYTGPSVGVSAGTDVSSVAVSNPATLSALLLSSLSGVFGGPGVTLPQVAQGLGQGLALMISFGLTTPGTGIVAPTGPVGPPSAGTSPQSVVV